MNGVDEPFAALVDWGWDAGWRQVFDASALDRLFPARVVAQHRGRWLLVGPGGEASGTVSGRFRFDTGNVELPAVGDWVGCVEAHPGHARIEALLPRRSLFRRRAAGPRAEAQTIAANVDTLFVATSLNGDLNPRRLERYVTMARESGAEPVVLLTKADLVAVSEASAASERIATDLRVAVTAVSGRTGEGADSLAAWLLPGATVAAVGSSGVGKSTLLNRLAGEELMATREIRDDDARGRHTTTHRELFKLPSGALLLDTPGMRELGLWDASDGLDETFAEVAALAEQCRFSDCGHDGEPGCAVREAIRAGELDERRLRSYRRLARELADQPPPAVAREARRRFSKAVRNISAETMARKTYRWHE